MENPDLVLQETGSRQTYSRLNYVPSGDTLRRDAIPSYFCVSMVFTFFLVTGFLKLEIVLGCCVLDAVFSVD